MTTKAVYDACVLFSASLRDFLLNLAYVEAVRARWSDDICNEWIHSLLQKRPHLKPESLEWTRSEMNRQFKNGNVRGYEHLIENLGLPDPNDRHVLAAAIHCKADWIVTFNLSDFPEKDLAPYGIKAIHPDDFVLHLSEANSLKVIAAAKEHRTSLRRPPKTVDEYLDSLRRQGLSKTVLFLEGHRSEI